MLNKHLQNGTTYDFPKRLSEVHGQTRSKMKGQSSKGILVRMSFSENTLGIATAQAIRVPVYNQAKQQKNHDNQRPFSYLQI